VVAVLFSRRSPHKAWAIPIYKAVIVASVTEFAPGAEATWGTVCNFPS